MPKIATKTNNEGFPKNKKVIIPKVVPSPVKVYTANIGRARAPSLRWEQPEFDLAECGRILDTEAFVRRAFRNKKNLFLKEGYEFVGPMPERVHYIKRRFRQMEEATGVPFEVLMTQTVWSLIRCSNAFWVKVRKTEASGGKVRVDAKGKTLKPVAGYFILPPENVRFKRDEYGKIVKYEQEIHGKVSAEFRPEEVIHFYFDKREGFSVGTPSLLPVKDDIRALRRIEENVELLVYQHLFPLFHYKVGTEKAPAGVTSDGRSEVEEIQYKVAMMPSDGCWVTPERHDIKPLAAGPTPVAIERIIEHFKQRIYTGLGVSSVDMGEGGTANRSTAQTMSRNLIDDTKADQREFSSQFEAFVIRELLLESTFSDLTVLDTENEVRLQFNEIDLEARQAKENHLVDIYEKNAITHDEMRMGMGYEPFDGEGWPTSTTKSKMVVKGDGDWAKTNYGLIKRDEVILQSLDEPGTDPSKAESGSRTTVNKAKAKENKAVSNKNQPSNQHGTRSSAKLNRDSCCDSFGSRNQIPSLDIVFVQRAPVQTMMEELRKDLILKVQRQGLSYNDIKLVTDVAFSEAKDKLVSLSYKAYRVGLNDAEAEVWDVKIDKVNAKIHGHINKYMEKLKTTLLRAIKRNTVKSDKLRPENATLIGITFDALQHRASMVDNSEVMRAYNYGKVSGFRVNGFEEMTSARHGNTPCNICDKRVLFYKESDAIIYEDLPPLHPHCTCTMEKKGN
jgi:hypothetical protein